MGTYTEETELNYILNCSIARNFNYSLHILEDNVARLGVMSYTGDFHSQRTYVKPFKKSVRWQWVILAFEEMIIYYVLLFRIDIKNYSIVDCIF